MVRPEELLERARHARKTLESTANTTDQIRELLKEDSFRDYVEPEVLESEDVGAAELSQQLERLSERLSTIGRDIEKIEHSSVQNEDEPVDFEHDSELETTLENEADGQDEASPRRGAKDFPSIVKVTSKRYEGKSFNYLWSVLPEQIEQIGHCKFVQFVRDDSGKSCRVTPDKVLTAMEKGSPSSDGCFDFMLLTERQNDLALATDSKHRPWHFVRITWGYGR